MTGNFGNKCKIQCENISLCVGDVFLLDKLNIFLKSGDFLIVQGKNGSGKTTLLNLISGISDCLTGSIKVEGSLSYLSHKNACLDGFNVCQNLEIWADVYNNKHLLQDTFRFFDLFSVLDIEYQKLSQGLKRRVAIARIMLANSDIYLLDEPYANIDIEASKKVDKLIEKKLKEGGIVVITSNQKIKNIEYKSKLLDIGT